MNKNKEDQKEKKKPIKAILYVSGDSLRVVDESNKVITVTNNNLINFKNFNLFS